MTNRTQAADRDAWKPDGLPETFPTTPIYSSRTLGWNGLVVERYQYPGGEYRFSLPAHCIAVNLGLPLRMWQARDGQVNDSLFLTNDLSILPAGVENLCWHADTEDALFIGLDSQFLTRTADAMNVDPNRVEIINHFGVHDPQLQHIASSLVQEIQAPGLGGTLYVEACANQLIVHLLRHYAEVHPQLEIIKQQGLAPDRLNQALAFINDQLDQELSLADMAAAVHLSSYHFARLFKQSLGLAPHQYVIRQRIEAAKRLLANRDLTTAQVAAAAGFADYSHLARHFKRLVGVSPQEFRLRKNLH